MRRCLVTRLVLVAVAVAAVAVHHVVAHPENQLKIPNGQNVVRNGQPWPGVGHQSAAGGDARNPFGLAFAAANLAWTTSLCQADSDGDGFSNGAELGDPNCVWIIGATPTRVTGISHPGFADSTPATTTAAPGGATPAPVMTLPTAPPSGTSAGSAAYGPGSVLAVAAAMAMLTALFVV
jgi:hypothetical protein